MYVCMYAQLNCVKKKKSQLFSLKFLVLLLLNWFFHFLYASEWSDGQVTEYLTATFGDYFMDVKM